MDLYFIFLAFVLFASPRDQFIKLELPLLLRLLGRLLVVSKLFFSKIVDVSRDLVVSRVFF